jgi:hypothetical protein
VQVGGESFPLLLIVSGGGSAPSISLAGMCMRPPGALLRAEGFIPENVCIRDLVESGQQSLDLENSQVYSFQDTKKVSMGPWVHQE